MLDAVLEEKTLEVKLELDCARAGLAIAAKTTMMAEILMIYIILSSAIEAVALTGRSQLNI